ncbi:MAG: hypothetical protein HPY74_05980 [Firmicutes bacterium]|nr:hypothetical protein [Bacillota bacterium]
MDYIAWRRKQIQWNIAQNPLVITISRTEKVETEGHFEEVKTQAGPFSVRIFPKGQRYPKEVSDIAGTKQVDEGWGLLANYQADIKAGPNVSDEFDVTGLGHFRITAVYPQVVMGQIAGYQADIEKVV